MLFVASSSILLSFQCLFAFVMFAICTLICCHSYMVTDDLALIKLSSMLTSTQHTFVLLIDTIRVNCCHSSKDNKNIQFRTFRYHFNTATAYDITVDILNCSYDRCFLKGFSSNLSQMTKLQL